MLDLLAALRDLLLGAVKFEFAIPERCVEFAQDVLLVPL